jgi:hypothetical protein
MSCVRKPLHFLLSAEKNKDQHWLCKRVAHFQGRKVQKVQGLTNTAIKYQRIQKIIFSVYDRIFRNIL